VTANANLFLLHECVTRRSALLIETSSHCTKVTEPIGGQLVLRHASKRTSWTWGPDDYDVIDSSGRALGRIFKARAGVPPEYPWMWTITGAVVMPDLPSSGFCATRRQAKAEFAKTWRAWLVFTR
jgi:hypothetical protein